MGHYVVLLPPPCTNNDLHMGHLAGVYIPGDIYARFLSMQGDHVSILSGADQNNTYTERKARQLNMPFVEVKKNYAEKIEQTLKDADIRLDNYVYTDSLEHKQGVHALVTQLIRNGFVDRLSVEQPYCHKCQQYVCDAEIQGICKYCKVPADGGICESCCMPLYNHHLLEATHTQCRNKVSFIKSRSLVLNLTRIKKPLQKMILASDWEPWLKKKTINCLANKTLENIPLTNHFVHGNMAGVTGLGAKHLAIWHEAIWAGITGLLQLYQKDIQELVEKLNQDNVSIVPFMGQDTEFYYVVALASVLYGLGVQRVYPRVSVQRFIKLDGDKFSSSRNHLIYLQDLYELYSLDTIRLYSLSILNPYYQNSNDFIVSELQTLDEYFKLFRVNVIQYARQNPVLLTSIEPIARWYNAYYTAMTTLNFKAVFRIIMQLTASIDYSWHKKSVWHEVITLLHLLKPIMPNTAAWLESKVLY